MTRTVRLRLLTSSLPLLLFAACAKDDLSYGYDGGGNEEGGLGDESGAPPTPEPPAPDPNEASEDSEDEPACNAEEEVVLYLSPDDSNSMSSPVQVRHRVLDDGSTFISDIAIRRWEFMNYYSFDYPRPEPGELELSAEMRTVIGEDEQPHYQLQLGVSSELMSAEQRPPLSLTLVLDTSGSMQGEAIGLLRSACEAIAASLRPGDSVSLVEWDTDNSWTLAGYEVSGPNDPVLLDKIAELQANGGTDLNGGLSSGYELAQLAWDAEAINRLVLISDGGANAGVTDIELIANNAAFSGADGIYLVGAGVDLSAQYNDRLMDEVTDAGKGASVFISDEAEAWKVFNTDFVNTMALAARDVAVELQLPPGFEVLRFSGEEYSADPTEIEPQHLAPNDTMVFFQELQTCAPDQLGPESTLGVRLSWIDPNTFEARSLEREYSFGELLEAEPSAQHQLAKGAAIFAYTELLATPTAAHRDAAEAAIDEALALRPEDPDLLEIDEVIAVLTGP